MGRQRNFSQDLIDGKQVVPGVVLPKLADCKEVPVGPEKPQLNLALWTEDCMASNPTAVLKLPDHLLRAWHDHPVHGATLQSFLASSRMISSVNQNSDEQTEVVPGSPGSSAKGSVAGGASLKRELPEPPMTDNAPRTI